MSPTGAAIMGAFGAVWWIIGVTAYGRAAVPLYGVGLIIAAAIIVGLHFLPLARWLPARLYYATATLLTLCGVAGVFVADAKPRIVLVTLGAASVLWLTCGTVLMSGGETG